MPIRRRRDGAVIGRAIDWERVTDFRAERLGRYEWRLDGEEYYVQQVSPSLQTMESSPEFMLAEMEHAGVDVAILQHDNIYGRYNRLFAETMRTYPGRFVGLLKIEESAAAEPGQITSLRRNAEELGLPCLFFQQAGLPNPHSTEWADADSFRPFWVAVQQLGLVVYLHGMSDYAAMARHFRRYPQTTFTFSLPSARWAREGKRHIPEPVADLMSQPNVLAEICPIAFGFSCEYPYTEMHPTIQPLYEEYGGGKFCRGTDMPNLERFCTYLQGLDFLRRHCRFISREDMPRILGGNAARAFGLATT